MVAARSSVSRREVRNLPDGGDDIGRIANRSGSGRKAGARRVTMALHCYRCGESLAALSLPLSRLDECPSCGVHLHCCRMCERYAPRLPKGCSEDDAPEVRDKKMANFCDYFKPSPKAYDPREHDAEQAARAALDALFKKT